MLAIKRSIIQLLLLRTKKILAVNIMLVTTHLLAVGAVPRRFEIGMPSPNIEFKNVKYHYKSRTTVDQLRGKPLIIYFWNLDCKGAVASLPDLANIQKNMKSEMQLFLVGNQDEQTKTVFEKYRKHYQFELPITFDSTIFNDLDIQFVPYIVVIDRNGIVRAITPRVTLDDVRSFVKGENTQWARHISNFHDIDFRKPLFIDGNGGPDSAFIFRSVLTEWYPELGMHWHDFQTTAQFRHSNWSSRNNRGIQITGADLSFLYRIAYSGSSYFRPDDSLYYGKTWHWPIIESEDSLKYIPDYKTGDNIYCYSLLVPVGQAEDRTLRKIMKNDLENYFGFNVSVEKRHMPYWKFSVIQGTKANLRSKGGEQLFATSLASGSAGVNFINVPMSTLIEEIWSYHQYDPPFIDETGLEDNIDIYLNAIMTDLADIKNALRRNGIDLTRAYKEMNVIILRKRAPKD